MSAHFISDMTIERMIRPILEIRKGEWNKTLLSFFYFFLTITAYYILKPARNSLYIEYIGVNNIPYAIIVIAIISLPIISFYAHCSKKIENNKLVTGFLLGSIVFLFFFRWAFNFHGTIIPRIVSFVFYVWLTLFSGITVMQFWTLINDIFDSQSAKRLYGFVGCGGIVGGMVGSTIARQATKLGTENLLLVSAVYILFMIFVYNYIWAREKSTILDLKSNADSDGESQASRKESYQIVKKSRYLIYILCIIALIKIVTVQTEWQYNKFVSLRFAEKDIRTAFLGSINYYLNVASFIVQLVFTSRILRKYGANIALIPLPLGLFVGSMAVLLFPGIQAAAILKISEGSLRYSINQSATNFLYMPVLSKIRYKIRPFIDVIGYQISKGLGGIITIGYIFLMTHVFAASEISQAKCISYLNILLLLVWFYVIFAIKREYPNQIRRFLCSVEKKTDPKNESQGIMAEFKDTAYEQSLEVMNSTMLSSKNRSVQVRMAVCVALYEGCKGQDQLKKLISEIMKAEGGGMRMSFPDSQDMVDEVLDSLSKKIDSTERYDAIKMLNKIRNKDNDYGFDKTKLYDQIFHEVDDYYKSLLLFVLYESLIKETGSEHVQKDFLYSSLTNILHENIERIFRILALIYSPVDMFMAYQSLCDKNPYIRANSLELLDHIVDQDLKKRIFPILDGELSITGPDSAIYYTSKVSINIVKDLKKALGSRDRWLTVCGMVIITKFQLSELYSDLCALQKSEDILVREAASFLCPRLEGAR